ncbi:hypothetical protein [Streptomyces avermitilis]|uniref:hypothetical protein n=1 Tax=Streptomyces avermitilis TaxID=33903 RepID=UPI00380EB438
MNKRLILSAAVLALAVTGCGGGDDSKADAKPSASSTYSKNAATCFGEVIKAVDKALVESQGETADIMGDEEWAAFEQAEGTPLWDIYVEYRDMGIKDLTNGVHATATDAVAAYAPSVKLECVKAYG